MIKTVEVALINPGHHMNYEEKYVDTVLELYHDVENQHDQYAIEGYLKKTDGEKLFIGYVTGSPHTTPEGCMKANELFKYLPGKQMPLLGRPIRNEKVTIRNGRLQNVLIAEIRIVVNK